MPTDLNPQDPVLERLRRLEGRLNSLGRRQSDDEPIRDMIRRRESQRESGYAEVLRGAASFASDISQAIDEKVAARLDLIRGRAIAMIESPPPRIQLADAERMLDAQETRVVALTKQFSAVRESAMKMEERLAGAGEMLEQVWKQQDLTGLGAWRTVMRSVSSQVELEKEEEADPSLVERHRGVSTVDEDIPVPSAKLVCRRCNQRALRRVNRVSFLEEVLRVVFVSPYLCGGCGKHSHRFGTR